LIFVQKQRSWCAKEETGPGATLIDSVFIEELEEDKAME
jgi:hypothetical protein